MVALGLEGGGVPATPGGGGWVPRAAALMDQPLWRRAEDHKVQAA